MRPMASLTVPLFLAACIAPAGPRLPTPFTAEEIQAGNPPGSARVFRVQEGDDVWITRTD